MATIITRVGKGSPLTNAEVDANFTNLNNELATKLDSAILSSYQPLDADLTAIAGLSGSTGILRKTAANTWSLDTSAYLTSFTETDPVFSASPAAGITGTNISNWNTAYGWGNHASAGYITSSGSITGNAGTVSAGITSNLNTIPSGLDAAEATFQRYDINAANKPVAVDNANGVLTMISHPAGGVGLYGKQIAFGDNDDLYMRYLMDGSFGSWRTLWHSGSGTISAVNDFRAPIFYDSANTNYYIDPNSGGTSVYTAGNAFFSGEAMVLRSNGIEQWATNGNAEIAVNYYGYAGGIAQPRDFAAYDGRTALRFKVHGNANYTFASGSVHSYVFYDSDNTGFYADPAGTSNFNGLNVNGGDVYRSSWVAGFQSTSDFASGTLVATDIPANIESGDSFLIEITGKSYSATNPPFKVLAQGYLYANLIISTSGISYGGDFASYIKVFEDGGVLKFWWPTVSYWNSFEVRVLAMNGPTNGNITRNRVTGITNSTEPTGSKKVQINLARNMRGDVSATNSVDLRAPIFYDSANTAYYVDPTGSMSINVAGNILAAGNVELANGSNRRIRLGSATNYNYDLTTNGDNFQIVEAGTTPRLTISYPSGAITASTDFRAPIFYDSDNTGFFLDPASTSRMSIINLNVLNNPSGVRVMDFDGPDYTLLRGPDSAIRFYIGRDNVPTYYDNDTHIFRNDGGVSQLMSISGIGTVAASADFRAPIFYDSNDTSRYIDPNGSSIIGNLTTSGSITSDGNIQQRHVPANGTSTMGIVQAGVDAMLHLGRTGTAAGPVPMTTANTSYIYTSGGLLHIGGGIADYLILDNGVMRRSTAHKGYLDGNYGVASFNSSVNPIYCLNGTYAPPSAASLGSMYGIGFADGGSSGVYAGAGWGMYAAAGGTARVFLDADNGIVFSTASLRTPIYYDSTNTAYYIDPSSTGTSIDVAGNAYIRGGNIFVLANPSGAGVGLRLHHSGGSAFFDLDGDLNFRNGDGGLLSSVNADGSVRSPLFYDLNNTGYYIDPNSTSNILGLTVGNTITGSVSGAAGRLGSADTRTIAPNSHSSYSITAGFTSWANNNTSPYADYIHFRSYSDGSGGSDNLLMLRKDTFGFRIWQQSFGSASAYSSYRDVVLADSSGVSSVTGSFRAPIFYDSDNTAYYLDASTTGTSLNVAGSIVAAGNVTAYSDARVKTEVETIPDALTKLSAIRGVTYKRTDLEDTQRAYAGVIAQEIEEVLPEAVFGGEERKTVDYNATIALLIQAVKELNAKVWNLEAELATK